MDVHKLRHKANFFNALKGLSKQDKLNYFQNCPNEAIKQCVRHVIIYLSTKS